MVTNLAKVFMDLIRSLGVSFEGMMTFSNFLSDRTAICQPFEVVLIFRNQLKQLLLSQQDSSVKFVFFDEIGL